MELQALLLVVCLSVTYGQDCPELQDSQLGSVAAPSSDGLLADALAAMSGEANPVIQILATNKVCLGQGTVRDTYRTVSIVVQYSTNPSGSINATIQAEFQCDASGSWGFGSQPSISFAPVATLTTPVRTNCTICINPDIAPSSITVSDVEHCAACDVCDPDGLMRCTGQASSQTCCNFFDMSGNCVETCPQNASSVNNSVCANINECDSGPCENGGTCSDLVNNFSCSCVSGFTGDTCMTNIDDCTPNPCANGGRCIDGIFDFTCVCAPGYTNNNCMKDINECDPNPCENGGNCIDGINEFTCICASGFVGDTCTIQCDIGDCLNCSESNVCTECEDGYRLTEANDCEESPNNTPIIIGVVVGVGGFLLLLLLLILLIIIFIVVRQKNKNKGEKNKGLVSYKRN